jgi:calcineurin-like phosphoesterase family protein
MANINKGIPMIWLSGDKHLFHEMMVKGKRGCTACMRPIKTTEPDGPTSCCQAPMIQTEAPPRPMFANVWDMNKRIIDNHNDYVAKGDIVYELGDMFLKINAKLARETRYLMNGNFYFVNGNHDQVAEQISDCFVWMKDLVRIKPKGFDTPHITLCHYAMRVWHGSHKGVWQLYGHSHGALPEDNVCPHCHHTQYQWLSMDVGVDPNDFYPVSIETVIKRMKEKLPLWEAWKASLKGRRNVGL